MIAPYSEAAALCGGSLPGYVAKVVSTGRTDSFLMSDYCLVYQFANDILFN
jgi:hypothetical protein